MTDFNQDRINRLEQLEEHGIRPYQYTYDERPSNIEEFVAQYEDVDPIESDEVWTLGGRITRQDEFGDFVFYDLDDRTGTTQVMCSIDDRSNFQTESFDLLEYVNMDDRLAFQGTASRSNSGELTLNAVRFDIIGPAVQDTGDRWNQLRNQKRTTQRTVALITEDELFENIQMRSNIVSSTREHLEGLGFNAVETPILQGTAGGADATRFRTYCEALDSDLFLRIAPELYLKRLVTTGFEQIYEIARSFRNEDIDTTHNPEFTLLELYQQYADYTDVMDLTENLYSAVAQEVVGTQIIEYDGQEIDLSSSWERVTFDDIVSEQLGTDINEVSRDYIIDYLTTEYDVRGEQLDGTVDDLLLEVFDYAVEPNLDDPTIVMDYPRSSTPLCQTTDYDDTRVERFEAFICGMEVANAYTELTDPREQVSRFTQSTGNEDDINEEFVEALSYGMPPTAGLGIGIDRMSMLLTDSQSIKEVIPYPVGRDRV